MHITDPRDSIAERIDAARQQDLPRPHMGASLLGHPCDRWLWLSFRWAVIEKHQGRILRLFRRGQMEEEVIVKDLESIGCRVYDRQRRVDFGCHVSGSIDGIVDGLKESSKPHLLECKTHGKKSFDDLVKHGLEKSKPQHVVQMQIYMLGLKLERALYYAVCKDDDRLFIERVRADRAVAEQAILRGQEIAISDRMPEPLSADPSWYQCKFCPAYSFCHGDHIARQVNCRTCALVTATEHGTWHCGRYEADGIPVEYQHAGCDCHVLHPDLVPWRRMPSPSPFEAIYLIGGAPIRNGDPCVNTISSKELLGIQEPADVDPSVPF